MTQHLRLLPGLILVACISGMAYGLNHFETVRKYGMGSLTLAIVLGACCGNLSPRLGQGGFRIGMDFCQRRLLRVGVALYGFNLSAQQIMQVGKTGILVDVLMVSSTLLAGWFIGTRLLKMERDTVILTAAGSAICGAAAVVATLPMLGGEEKERAEKGTVAVATVVLFGTLSMLIYPLLYRWLGDGYLDFGIYIGSTVHEVAQVVAIGNILGSDVAGNAVIVKMIRVMLLMPFLLVLGFIFSGGKKGASRSRSTIPWFAIVFVAFAGVNSLHVVPETVVHWLQVIGIVCLTAAMAALGLGTNLHHVGKAGGRPLVLGGLLFVHLVFSGALFNFILS